MTSLRNYVKMLNIVRPSCVAGPTATQNSSFIHCTDPRRDGQAEWAGHILACCTNEAMQYFWLALYDADTVQRI